MSPPKPKWLERNFAPLIVLVLTLIVGVTFWLSERISQQMKKDLGESLEVVLKTSQGALQVWARDLRADNMAIAQQEPVRNAIVDLVRSGGSRVSAVRLEALLTPQITEHHYLAFQVFGRDGLPIAIGRRSRDHWEDRGTIQEALRGQFARSNPLELAGSRVAITAASPIRDRAGGVIAALAFFLDPAIDFTKMTQVGRMGESGETYAVDRAGRMITESRFVGQLRQAGIIHGLPCMVPLSELRDPGGNLLLGFAPQVPRETMPLTQMAGSLVKGNSGMNLDGYRDYRGVEVVGAWLWDKNLGFGLATEVDRHQAYLSINMVRRLTWLIAGVLLFGAMVLLSLFKAQARMRRISYASEEASRAREELLATVAHDLKNPLTAILMTDEILLKTLPAGEVMERRRKLLETLRGSAEQMKFLIEDLHLMAGMRAGKVLVHPMGCQVEALVHPLIAMFEPLASAKRISVTFEAAEGLPQIWAAAERLTRVFSNLLGNALKFTPPGGSVVVRAMPVGAEVEFSVADSGVGIAPGELSLVFERYWQAEVGVGKGMGLGLAISKGIVDAHGGRIWVESAVGRGSTFHFTIPVAQSVRLSSIG
ncbi:MAG: sensor histidine kinase [Bdellovibrionota bacterium]